MSQHCHERQYSPEPWDQAADVTETTGSNFGTPHNSSSIVRQETDSPVSDSPSILALTIQSFHQLQNQISTLSQTVEEQHRRITSLERNHSVHGIDRVTQRSTESNSPYFSGSLNDNSEEVPHQDNEPPKQVQRRTWNTPWTTCTQPNVAAAAETQLEPATNNIATMADGSTAGLRLPDVLFNLHHIDFRRPSDLKRWKSIENTPFFAPLFSSMHKYDNDATYTVQNYWSTWLYLLCRTRDEPSLISNYYEAPEWKNIPDIIELDTSTQSHKPNAMSFLLPPGPEFPRYVLDLGEVFVQRRCPISHQMIQRSSGFHLVMDITKPEKPLWIVYRYHEIGPGEQLDSTPVYKQDLVWHPFASAAGIEFDSAQVFASAAEWRGDHTTPDIFEAAVKSVKHTGKIRKPTFVEPVLCEVKQEIEKGWSGPKKKKR